MSDESTALAVSEASSLKRATVTEQVALDLRTYKQLQQLLDAELPDCMVDIAGNLHRTKEYWLAVAVAFILTTKIESEQRIEDGVFDDGRPNFAYIITVRATAPNGRSMIGDGSCSAVEKAEKFRCPHPHPTRNNFTLHYPGTSCPDYDPGHRWRHLPEQATLHNIHSHAVTRATNRAVSNLVGFGEVSAEEMQQHEERREPRPARTPTTAGRTTTADQQTISPAQAKRLWAIAKSNGWEEHEVRTLFSRFGVEHTEEIPRHRYDAIIAKLESGIDGREAGSEG